MKVGIEGIDLTAVTGKQQIYNMYVYYMPYALFPQMIYLVLWSITCTHYVRRSLADLPLGFMQDTALQ